MGGLLKKLDCGHKLIVMKFTFQSPNLEIKARVLNDKTVGLQLLQQNGACVFPGRIFNIPNLVLNNHTLNNPSLNNHALNNPALRNPALNNSALNNSTPNNPTLNNPALNNPAFNSSAINNLALNNNGLHNSTLNKLALNNPAINNPALHNPALNNPAFTNSAFNKTAVNNLALKNNTINNNTLNNPALKKLAFNNHALNNPTLNKPALYNTILNNPALNPTLNPLDGTYHCDTYSHHGRCDVCSHMEEQSFVQSEFYNGRKFAIHGRNVHSKATEGSPMKWFVYLEEDLPCHLQYVGSTVSMTSGWANTKMRCNKRDSDATGLYKHFRDGCPNDTGVNKQTIRISLIDFMDTTPAKLLEAGHKKKGNCLCEECDKLKNLELEWILKLGTFYGDSGLNVRKPRG